MVRYKRVSQEVTLIDGGSRLRINIATAEAWGITQDQDLDCIGFFREKDELLCVPVAVSGDAPSALETVLRLERHSDDTEVPGLEALPSAKALVAPDRLVPFAAKWKDRQLELQIGRNAARNLGYREEQKKVRIITWRGWLVILSIERFERYLTESW